MKFKFMLPLLFIPAGLALTNPVLASQVDRSSECSNMYRGYLNDSDTSRLQLLNFIGRCIPASPAEYDEPLHRKLLQITDEEENIITVKA